MSNEGATQSNQRVVSPLRILIMGAGSIGSSVAGFMGKAGHDVTMVGHQEHMDAVREQGLKITGIWGEHHVAPLKTQTDLAGLRRSDFDLIYVSVKSYDTPTAAKMIEPLVDDDTLVCAFQNGLGNAEALADVLGWEHVIGASVIYGAWLPEPGHVDVTVIAHPTTLGMYVKTPHAARVRAIAEAMDAAKLPTVYSDEIATVLWAKIAYNSALNPLSALLDVPYGVLAETSYAVDTMREVVTELYAVANAMGVPMRPATAPEYMEHLVHTLIPPTAAHYASMREDFRLRRRTEIEALNGAICRFGTQHGVPCPTNALLTRLVHAREYALGVRY